MPITVFNPDDTFTAGNVVINLMPAVANIKAPTLAEWNAGTMIQCATEEFESSTAVKTNERKKLCDKVSTQVTGSRTYSASDTAIVSGDPQGATPYPAIIIPDATVYVGVRPGLDHTVAAAAAQKVWIDERQVLAIDPVKITTDDGDAFQWTIQWAVKDRTYSGNIVAP